MTGVQTPPSLPNLSPVGQLLAEQQQLTAVERFAQRHASTSEPLVADHYTDSIPLSAPGPGEQYAFEVDLDACTGCKSCVAACHNLNGLEENEFWRSVGMLQGGTATAPVLQHVTTACHHCLDPACLTCCPVMAYDKDPQTGIVRHLDDQCIGCQYCMFACPYDVPVYSPSKGIVRKCDMCHDRLAVGEPPACVQSCPNGAIRIRTVSQEEIVERSEGGHFLPAAPAPDITLPTTDYKTSRPLPRNLLPADYYSANPQHSHLALVFMLVLTQLSVGAFVVSQALVSGPWAAPEMLTAIRPIHALTGLLLGLLGIHAAVFHLGRPRYAYRALLGLKTSWLSREILVFGIFAGFAAAHAAIVWLAADWPSLVPSADALGLVTAAVGLAAVFCSVMIYAKTRRPFWNLPLTSSKFFLTSAVLGIPISLFVSLVACRWHDDLTAHTIMSQYGQALCRWLILATAAKLFVETLVLANLRQKQFTPLKRTALLLTGDLSMTSLLRHFFAAIGGLLLPVVLLSDRAAAAGPDAYDSLFLGFAVVLIFGLLLIGELIERYLFFAASSAARMPGAPCP